MDHNDYIILLKLIRNGDVICLQDGHTTYAEQRSKEVYSLFPEVLLTVWSGIRRAYSINFIHYTRSKGTEEAY